MGRMMEAGMTDGADSGENPFEALDPKLTMFALANGMDLSKGEDHRRLEWFSDGLERGILVRPAGTDTYWVGVLSWRSRAPEHRREATAADAVGLDDTSAVLTAAIEAANALDAPD